MSHVRRSETPMGNRTKFESKILAMIAVAVLVVVALAVTTWKLSRDSTEAALRMSQTHEVLNNIAQARGETHSIELNTQSFRITGDPARLTERDAAVAARETALHRVAQLTADDQPQQDRLMRLRAVIEERLVISRRTEQLRKTEGPQAAAAYIATAPLKETRERLLRLLDDMENEERRQLQDYSEVQPRARLTAIATGALAVLALLALLAATYFVIRRQMRLTESSRRAREEAQAHTQLIFDSVAEGLHGIGLDGKILFENPAAARMLGWDAQAMIGRPAHSLMHHSHADGSPYPQQECPIYATLHDGQGRHVENEVFWRKDGTSFPVAYTSTPMRDDAGALVGVVVAFRDITETKQAEAQAARTLRELADFKAALDQHALVSTTDADGTITYANDKFCAVSKYSRDELIGRNHRIVNSGHHPKEFFDELWLTISGGQVWKGEIMNRARDGSFYWVDTSIVPFLDEQSKPVQYIAIRTDITQRKAAEQALIVARNEAEQANRAKDAFLATMSHEIRTPLGGLLGMLELLSLSPLNAEQSETLRAASDSGRSLLRILNDILDWSKIEEGKLELAPRAVPIRQLVAEVVSTYVHVASANSVTLTQQVDPCLSAAHRVDPLRLSQILNNFVSNAIKFSHGGRVELRAERVAQHEGAEEVRFAVIDTGIGIEPAIQRRLFRSYSQASADISRMYGGTGLGLAISRRLADLLGGRIDLESEPGHGATFSLTLTLPVAPALAPPHATAPSADLGRRHAAGTDAPLVLVVDDHPTNRKLLAVQLGLFGLRAEIADNGEAALALWRSGRHALLITDCHMPTMDGYELTRAIRAIEAESGGRHTPIFAWTANALPGEVDKCLAVGMDELLVKPVNLAQLGQALEKWLPLPANGATPDAAAVPPAPTSGPLDGSALAALVGDDPAIIRELLLEFRSSATGIAAELATACAAGRADQVQALAHRLKSAARAVGAYSLGELCAELEAAGNAGQVAALDALHARFTAEMTAVDAALVAATATNGNQGEGP